MIVGTLPQGQGRPEPVTPVKLPPQRGHFPRPQECAVWLFLGYDNRACCQVAPCPGGHLSHETPWPRCYLCSQSFSWARGGRRRCNLTPPTTYMEQPPQSSSLHSDWLTSNTHTVSSRKILRLQPWTCPTALPSSSRTTLSSLTASLCWRNPTTLRPTTQPRTPGTSVPAAACLPPPLWTPFASPRPPSRPSPTTKTPWSISSSAATKSQVWATKPRRCLAPGRRAPPPPPPPRGRGPSTRARSGRQPVRGRSWGWGIWPRLSITSGRTSHPRWPLQDRPWPRSKRCASPSATSHTCRTSWASARRRWRTGDPPGSWTHLKPSASSWVRRRPTTDHHSSLAVTAWARHRCRLLRTPIRYVQMWPSTFYRFWQIKSSLKWSLSFFHLDQFLTWLCFSVARFPLTLDSAVTTTGCHRNNSTVSPSLDTVETTAVVTVDPHHYIHCNNDVWTLIYLWTIGHIFVVLNPNVFLSVFVHKSVYIY